MHAPPAKLNPFQRLVINGWFVFGLLIYVAILGVVDVARTLRDVLEHPDLPLAYADGAALRLVCIGVFFELRGTFVVHLLGPAAAQARGPSDTHLSETCEVFGGYLLVAGIFVELFENTRELLEAFPHVNLVGTCVELILSLLSLHIMYDFVRALRRPPTHGSTPA